jgi:SNF2 family DNA or RNA helicase
LGFDFYFSGRRYKTSRLFAGATPKDKRLRLVDAFNADKTPVFLISLKAGGTGLNLTGAQAVIHADPWWNVAAENQATDRAHRIGQKNDVNVYKVICKDTIEERILALQESKANLADQIVGKGDGMSLSSLSKDDLMDLLG